MPAPRRNTTRRQTERERDRDREKTEKERGKIEERGERRDDERREKEEEREEKKTAFSRAPGGGMYVSVSLFCSFSHKKTQSGTRAFHDMCCSKPLTFHNGFMFFACRSCFKHFCRFLKELGLEIKLGLTSEKELETTTRSKNHETIVEGQRL